MERLVYNQLYLFLEKNDIIYKYQFGFRKGYSTEQAILEITDNLNSAIDNKQITCGLFLDFSKAFDTVNHNILLSKLYTYGIRGTPFKVTPNLRGVTLVDFFFVKKMKVRQLRYHFPKKVSKNIKTRASY